MPTRSMPIVSCTSSRRAIGDLGADAVGGAWPAAAARYALSASSVEEAGEAAEAADDLGAPCVRATDAFISSTARSPASMSTPAAA